MKGRSQSSSIPKKRFNAKRETQTSREEWDVARIAAELKRLGERRNVEGMAGFGIRAKKVLGVPKPKMDELARKIGKNHELGSALWETGIHDARILAGMIGEKNRLTGKQMERWVREFDNWDVCDGTCCHLFVFAEPAWEKAHEWSGRKKEFEKRAGFAMAAYLAYRDKEAPDAKFRTYLKVIEREAWDERNFVRKAVNWALRNIGKRNLALNRAAVASAKRIQKQGTTSARWIAADALRELTGDAVQERLRRKSR